MINCFPITKVFAVLSLVSISKCFFMKKCQVSFSFNFFLWTCKYFYCHCIYNCVKSIHLLCWVYKKTNSFLSFHSPIFYSKIHKRCRTFLKEGGEKVKRIGTNKGEEGSKIGKFEQTYFFSASYWRYVLVLSRLYWVLIYLLLTSAKRFTAWVILSWIPFSNSSNMSMSVSRWSLNSSRHSSQSLRFASYSKYSEAAVNTSHTNLGVV